MAKHLWGFLLPGFLTLILLAIPTVTFSEDEITEILRQRIKQKQGVGIVVGVIDENGTKVIPYGKMYLPDGDPVDGRTIFEIGAITAVFTSLLLAQAVERGEVKLDDPVQKYLPPDVKMPTRNGRQITLLDLATHRSGLPNSPGNLYSNDYYWNNPYVHYSLQQMYDFLSSYNLTRNIGSEYEWSFGITLIAEVLKNRTGKDYQSLIRRDIWEPLNMTENTCICPVPENLATRMASGYDKKVNPIGNRDPGVFAGVVGICSDVEDLLKFLAANMNKSGPLGSAMNLTHQAVASKGPPAVDTGLGWVVSRVHTPSIICHDSTSGGYSSFIGFEPERRRGVVLLSNSANYVNEIGLHLLNPKYEL